MNRAAAPPDFAEQLSCQPATLSDVGLFRLIARHTGRRFESRVRGSSMGNALPQGSLIRIAHHEARAWHIGEVVAFLAGDRIVVHRVAYVGRGERSRGFLITQGDGNWACDPPVAPETVAGRVAEIHDGAGWRAVTSGKPPLLRRVASYPSRAVLRLLLEYDPTLALVVAKRTRRLHTLLRRAASKVWFGGTGRVRN